NVRKGNALFDLRRLADIGQVQIVLGKSGPGQTKNGNTKSSWPRCFHNFVRRRAITLLRFSALRYQIIVSLSPSLINARIGANYCSTCFSIRLDWSRYSTAGVRDFVGVGSKLVSLCRGHRPRLQLAAQE